MGCDIELYVELRRGDVWRQATPSELLNAGFEDGPEGSDPEIYEGRNYRLFAMLADVRNDYGIVPIDSPRGIPSGASISPSEWDCDAHSLSWFTTRELLDYDWTQVIIRRALVDAREYGEWDGESPPSSCHSSASGRSVVVMDRQEYDGIVERGEVNPNSSYHVRIEWTITYEKMAPVFHDFVLPRLASLGDPDDVRIVFWFDN